MGVNVRKVFLYMIGIVLFCFIIPIMFTEQFKTNETATTSDGQNNSENLIISNEQTIEEYEYKNDDNINVLFTKDNSIKKIKLDEYLYGVLSAEMPASYNLEALKAQAVVARTYTLYKIENNSNKHGEANICTDSTCCQAWISKEDRMAKWDEKNRDEYWNKITNAINSTKGQIITYEGKLINAFFHANSGGKTEPPINVWGGSGYPYLQTVETSGEEGYSQYKSEAEFTNEELLNKLKQKDSNIEIDFSKEDEIKVIERFESGRIKTIKFGNIEIAGVEARTLFGLRSANFEIERKDNKIKFTVYGYGHGVGMSQTGADSLAKQGKKYDEIIKHFYIDVEIENY